MIREVILETMPKGPNGNRNRGDEKSQKARYRVRVLDEKRFNCDTCEKCFGTAFYLRKHMDTLLHIKKFILY